MLDRVICPDCSDYAGNHQNSFAKRQKLQHLDWTIAEIMQRWDELSVRYKAFVVKNALDIAPNDPEGTGELLEFIAELRDGHVRRLADPAARMDLARLDTKAIVNALQIGLIDVNEYAHQLKHRAEDIVKAALQTEALKFGAIYRVSKIGGWNAIVAAWERFASSSRAQLLSQLADDDTVERVQRDALLLFWTNVERIGCPQNLAWDPCKPSCLQRRFADCVRKRINETQDEPDPDLQALLIQFGVRVQPKYACIAFARQHKLHRAIYALLHYATQHPSDYILGMNNTRKAAKDIARLPFPMQDTRIMHAFADANKLHLLKEAFGKQAAVGRCKPNAYNAQVLQKLVQMNTTD